MNKRFGLVGILAVGCLALIPSMQGCSSSNGSDGGTADASTDAGHTDGGSADSGTTVDTHGMGQKCANGDGTQSTCSRNFVCIGISPLNMCTKEGCDPNANTGCGQTEAGVDNVCIGSSTADSLCMRGCDPTVMTSPCVRPDFSCWAFDNGMGGQIGICAPDCRQRGNDCYHNDFGGYGWACDQNSGQCAPGPMCNTNADCMMGQVCYNDTSRSTPMKMCIDDCRTSGHTCPGARTCNMTTGICDPVPYGSICQTPLDCDANSLCVTLSQGATNGECLAICTKDTDCTNGNGAKCDLPLQNGQNVCEPPHCDLPTDGGMPADAGTADGGAADAGTAGCGMGEMCTPLQFTGADGGAGSMFGGCVPQ